MGCTPDDARGRLQRRAGDRLQQGGFLGARTAAHLSDKIRAGCCLEQRRSSFTRAFGRFVTTLAVLRLQRFRATKSPPGYVVAERDLTI